ncbi:hypothetical protein PanWU01x14_276050, partial [Parasponia andersonii]
MNYLSSSQIHDKIQEVEGCPRFVDFSDKSRHIAQVFVVRVVARHCQLDLELKLVKGMDLRVMEARMTMMDLNVMTGMDPRVMEVRMTMMDLKVMTTEVRMVVTMMELRVP